MDGSHLLQPNKLNKMTTNPRTDKAIAASTTVLVHVLTILALMFLMRDCGGSAGNGIGMGGGTGGGFTELDMALLGESPDGGGGTSDSPQSESSPPPSGSPDQNVMTAENAANPNIKSNPNKTNTTNTNNNTTNNNTKPNPLFDKLDDNKDGPKGPGSDPTKTSGDPNGSITGKGVFGGGGGGNGGSGYEWTFSRQMATKPSLDETIAVEGSIVVNVIVDKTGRVLDASVDVGSSKYKTGSKAELNRLAIKAAKSAKFAADPAGGGNKSGKITINFKLK